MQKILLLYVFILFSTNAYAIDFEMLKCSSGKPDKVIKNGNCSELYKGEEEILYASLCEYSNISFNEAYNEIIKKYAYGLKDYPNNIPTKTYDKDGLTIEIPLKNKVHMIYYGEGYYFEGLLLYDEKNKTTKATICQAVN